jgi:hypothetical protein
LGIGDFYAQESDNLLELFWRHLEVVVSIEVLEEALGVESFSLDQELELVNHLAYVLSVAIIWHLSAVECLGSTIAYWNCN